VGKGRFAPTPRQLMCALPYYGRKSELREEYRVWMSRRTNNVRFEASFGVSKIPIRGKRKRCPVYFCIILLSQAPP